MTCPACGLTNLASARTCSCGHDLDIDGETLAKVRRENRIVPVVMLTVFAAGLAFSAYACHQITTNEWLLM